MHHTALLIFFSWFFALPVSAATVTALDREPIKGAISGIDNQKRLLVAPESGGQVGIALDSIEEVDFGRALENPSADVSPLRIVLIDGSAFVGKIVTDDDDIEDTFCMETLRAGKIRIAIDDVARLELRKHPQALTDAPPTANELESPGKQKPDCKFYKPDGKSFLCRLYGIREDGAIVYVEGFDEEGQGSRREWKEMRTLVRRDEELKEKDSLFAIIATDRGDKIMGEITSWKDGLLQVDADFASGVKEKQEVPLEIREEHIVNIVFKNGRFVYLSDMAPSKTKEHPYFRSTDFNEDDHLFPYQKDKAQGGGALSIAGKRYSKGLGVHAISNLTYATNRRFTKFISVIGIDDSAGELASVEFKVLVDGKEAQFSITELRDGEQAERKDKTTGVIRKSHGSLRIEVDIAGAQEVALVVDAADNADVNDRANWANAKFVR